MGRNRNGGSIEERVLWDGTQSFRFDLSQHERLVRTERLRELNDELEALKEKWAGEKKRIEREKRDLLDTAANGFEYRDVPCHDIADLEALEVVRVRLDTGEVVSRRKMTSEERQESLGYS